MTVRIEIDDKDFKRYLDRLSNFSLRRAMVNSAGMMHSDVINHFETQTDSNNKRWGDVKNPPKTGTVLQRTGTLRGSIFQRAKDDNAEVGTNVDYAAVHNFGFQDRNIPKREFLWISDDAIEQIQKAILSEIPE